MNSYLHDIRDRSAWHEPGVETFQIASAFCDDSVPVLDALRLVQYDSIPMHVPACTWSCDDLVLVGYDTCIYCISPYKWPWLHGGPAEGWSLGLTGFFLWFTMKLNQCDPCPAGGWSLWNYGHLYGEIRYIIVQWFGVSGIWHVRIHDRAVIWC